MGPNGNGAVLLDAYGRSPADVQPGTFQSQPIVLLPDGSAILIFPNVNLLASPVPGNRGGRVIWLDAQTFGEAAYLETLDIAASDEYQLRAWTRKQGSNTTALVWLQSEAHFPPQTANLKVESGPAYGKVWAQINAAQNQRTILDESGRSSFAQLAGLSTPGIFVVGNMNSFNTGIIGAGGTGTFGPFNNGLPSTVGAFSINAGSIMHLPMAFTPSQANRPAACQIGIYAISNTQYNVECIADPVATSSTPRILSVAYYT